ncbi:hypothetical protein DV736_g4712, partial [Chaetothyriales sp. CBS 134916]
MEKSEPKRGNILRAEWRHKCRAALAEHLSIALGISIEPEEVRLQPKVKDGISDKSVEAVAQPEFADAPSRSSVRIFYSRLPGDFPAEHTPRDDHSIAIGKLDAKINEIQTENEKLLVDLEQSQEAAQSKRLLYCQAESRIQQLELELSTLRAEHMQLASTNDQLNKRIEQSDDDLKKLWSVVYSLGPGR